MAVTIQLKFKNNAIDEWPNTNMDIDVTDKDMDLKGLMEILNCPMIDWDDMGAPSGNGDMQRHGDDIKFKSSGTVRRFLQDVAGYSGTINILDGGGTTHHLTFTDGQLTNYTTS